jgi:hypothetical protein
MDAGAVPGKDGVAMRPVDLYVVNLRNCATTQYAAVRVGRRQMLGRWLE